MAALTTRTRARAIRCPRARPGCTNSFATGNLTSYGYAYGTDPYNSTEIANRKSSGDALQHAIWSLEDEVSGVTTGNNQYLAAAVTHFGSLANAKAADRIRCERDQHGPSEQS